MALSPRRAAIALRPRSLEPRLADDPHIAREEPPASERRRLLEELEKLEEDRLSPDENEMAWADWVAPYRAPSATTIPHGRDSPVVPQSPRFIAPGKSNWPGQRAGTGVARHSRSLKLVMSSR